MAATKGSKRGLVLGGGGVVGMAYHAGALKGLQEAGIEVGRSDVIVGTSAGSIIGAYLASGWDQGDFYEYAFGRHPNVSKDPDDPRDAVRQLFEPLWDSNAERVRRYIGSAFALIAARGHWARFSSKIPSGFLRKAFPSGLYSTERTRERFEEEMPEQWPDRSLFVCAADLYTGERVPFGHPDAPPASVAQAVLASTAIPGVFPPVRIGDRQYVDGGAVSATSLDLAANEGCTTILCIAPLGYRNEGALIREPKLWGPMLSRSLFARSLRREVNDARDEGAKVLVIRPWIDELAKLGTNAMRHFDREAVADAARMGTLKLVRRHPEHPALQALRAEASA